MASSTTFNPSTREDRKGAEGACEKAQHAGAEAFEKGKEAAKEAGNEALGKVKEAGAQVMGKAREAAQTVGKMATDTASAVGRKADDMTATAGHKIEEFADTMGRNAPHSGIAGQASQAFAGAIKEGGHYLEEAKLSGMARDVEEVVKNHPIPALLICLGIGYCVGRAMKD